MKVVFIALLLLAWAVSVAITSLFAMSFRKASVERDLVIKEMAGNSLNLSLLVTVMLTAIIVGLARYGHIL